MKVTKELADINEVMGEDAGFLKVRFMCEALERQADAGDESARAVLEFVSAFRKLVLLAQTESHKTNTQGDDNE